MSCFWLLKTKKKCTRSDSDESSDEESPKKKKNSRTFHSFPYGHERRKQWLLKIDREDWSPAKSSVICSDHFLEKDIDRTGQNVRLRHDAVPKRFKKCPCPLKKQIKQQQYKILVDNKEKTFELDMVNAEPCIEKQIKQQQYKILVDNKEKTFELDMVNAEPCIEKQIKQQQYKILVDNKEKTFELDMVNAEPCIEKYNHRIEAPVENNFTANMSNETKSNILKNVVKHLRQEYIISSSCEEMLNHSFSGVSLDITRRIASRKPGSGHKFPSELKSFALTLQFYFAKAYDLICKTFKLALPHKSQMPKWYSTILAEPGFTEPVFNALKMKVNEAEKSKLLCSLVIDEITIRKHISWDGYSFRCYVDVGNGIQDDSSPVAKDALVFMVVNINGSWKVPFAYFLIGGLSGGGASKSCQTLYNSDFQILASVVSLTCDGPFYNFSMLSVLGASLKPPNVAKSIISTPTKGLFT
eukprot:gene5759-6462_t